jgi:signal transduction histidine kinase
MELEKLRDDLIQMIVHDMRTPLTGILTGLETIIDADYEDELTREFVPMAMRSSETLLEMVNTLLDIHKMESGAMELRLSTFDFANLAHESLDQVRGIAASRDQELSLCLETGCGPMYADEEKIRRVVVNLLGNALKFTQSGGRISLSSWCDGGRYNFAVSDDGPGIPPEYQEKVFDKFGQVQARSEGHKHSTGLGLTFCKMVVVAHGGGIGLQSAVGEGTTFTVSLPLAPAPPRA